MSRARPSGRRQIPHARCAETLLKLSRAPNSNYGTNEVGTNGGSYSEIRSRITKTSDPTALTLPLQNLMTASKPAPVFKVNDAGAVVHVSPDATPSPAPTAKPKGPIKPVLVQNAEGQWIALPDTSTRNISRMWWKSHRRWTMNQTRPPVPVTLPPPGPSVNPFDVPLSDTEVPIIPNPEALGSLILEETTKLSADFTDICNGVVTPNQ